MTCVTYLHAHILHSVVCLFHCCARVTHTPLHNPHLALHNTKAPSLKWNASENTTTVRARRLVSVSTQASGPVDSPNPPRHTAKPMSVVPRPVLEFGTSSSKMVLCQNWWSNTVSWWNASTRTLGRAVIQAFGKLLLPNLCRFAKRGKPSRHAI